MAFIAIILIRSQLILIAISELLLFYCSLLNFVPNIRSLVNFIAFHRIIDCLFSSFSIILRTLVSYFKCEAMIIEEVCLSEEFEVNQKATYLSC